MPAGIESNGTTNISDADFELEGVPNKGPLLTTAMALFGAGSFVANRVAHPEAYINADLEYVSQTCIEPMPFKSLLSSVDPDDILTPIVST